MAPRPFAPWLSLAALLGLAACELSNSFSDRSVDESELPAAGGAGEGWQSAPFPTREDCDADDGEAEPWLELEGRQRLEVPHGLGRRPSEVLAYVAFEERGCGATLASGDIARIFGVDDDVVIIENATNERFALRVYLE